MGIFIGTVCLSLLVNFSLSNLQIFMNIAVPTLPFQALCYEINHDSLKGYYFPTRFQLMAVLKGCLLFLVHFQTFQVWEHTEHYSR